MGESSVSPVGTAPAPQLSLVKEQLKRSPYVLLLFDSILAWILTRSGESNWIVGWVAISAVLQFARAKVLRGIEFDEPSNVAHQLRVIDFWFFVNGFTRVWPIAVAFAGSPREDQAHYLVTIFMVGLAAGGVGTAAGMVRAYLAWLAPVATALVLGWAFHRSFEGWWTALLLMVLFGLLTVNVRNFGATLNALRTEVHRANEERDRAEAERLRADEERQRAHVAVMAKSRFFAAASHDLRQPIGVLRWYGDAVRVHAERLGHEPLQAIGEGIGRALAHAEPLIGKYLDIAKLDAGALDLAARPIQVVALLEQVREAYARDAQAAGLDLVVEIASSSERMVVFCDESLLRSILDNLVGNAIKFTPKGRVVLRALLVDDDGDERVRIAIEDTGIGIAEEAHEQVFEDFFQVGNAERSRTLGLGLGLSIVRRQAGLLGTSVRLKSALGHGSRFEFDLPLEAAPQPANLETATAAKGMAEGRRLRILVVDDEPEVRVALRLMLESVRWQVQCAAGLEDAMAMLQDGFAPDALVVDFRLRGTQSGVRVAAELRRERPVPAVIVTGDTSPEQLAELRASGLPVLHKPVEGERLTSTILNLVA